MRDILPSVDRWIHEGRRVAIAAVVHTWGSSPRGIGARMAFTSDGRMAGSVSGGCVEGAVIAAGLRILNGDPPELLHFDVTDETAWGVGLTCGGSVDVFVSQLDETLVSHLRPALESQQSTTMITVIRGPRQLIGRTILRSANGSVYDNLSSDLDQERLETALGGAASEEVELADGIAIFRDVFTPQPTLIIIGGVHIATALAPLAHNMGWRSIVIDPRKAWTAEGRFAEADQLLPLWPQDAFAELSLNDSCAVVTLTHDPKLDDPALLVALHSTAFYVGALGSAGSQAKRRARLRNQGLTEAELGRLHAPVGLEIGAKTPEEIALAIMAEVISEYRLRPRARPHDPNNAVSKSPAALGAAR